MEWEGNLDNGGQDTLIRGKVHVEDFEDASDEFEYRVEATASDAQTSLNGTGRSHLTSLLQTWRQDVLMKQ